MFIVSKDGVLCVCEHWQMWSIRSIGDVNIGTPWIESGTVGNATFMLVREVSISPDMVI